MRNVQQWTRDLDNTTIRVFPYAGKMKTVVTFLEGANVSVSNPKGISGVVLHIPGDQISVQAGAYILRRVDNSITILDSEDELFQYMGSLGYRYKGNERVRNQQITEEFDGGLVRRWGIWVDSTRVDDPGKIYPQRDSLDDVTAPAPDRLMTVSESLESKAQACGDTHAPDGWECTRAEGHDGPCAGVPKEIETTTMEDAVTGVRTFTRPNAPAEPVRTGSANPYQWKKEGIAASIPEPTPAPKKTWLQKLLGFFR